MVIISALGRDNQNSTSYITEEFVVAYIKGCTKNRTAKRK